MDQPRNWRRLVFLGLLGTFVLYLAYRLVLGLTTTEEDRIRSLLQGMAEEVEEKRPLALISHLTDDFVLEPDGWQRFHLKGILLAQLRSQEQVSVALRQIEVQPRGEEATVTLQVGVARGGKLKAGFRPDEAYEFHCFLVKDDGEWKVRRAEKEGIPW